MSKISIHSIKELAEINPEIREMYERAQRIPELKTEIRNNIDKIISIFQQYDRVQLLGGLSLKHLPEMPLDNKDIPMPESLHQEDEQGCSSSSCGFGLEPAPQDVMSEKLDQLGCAIPKTEDNSLGLEEENDWNIIMEYALSFSSSIQQNGSQIPTPEIITQLYSLLKETKDGISLLEMERSGSYEEDCIKFFSHLITIGVRGDAYPQFYEDVFKGLFGPHDKFFKTKYGFTSDDVLNLVTDLEKRIYSKVNNNIGLSFSWMRFVKWNEDLEKGDIHIVDDSIKDKTPFELFFQCNPDMYSSETSRFGLYEPENTKASSMIFWIVPNSDAEEKILTAFSHCAGENSSFIQEGDFKGFITNESVIYTKPFLKENDRFYCFSHLLPYVQLFEMMEFLLKQDVTYYNQNYQQNTAVHARDNYFEKKVKKVFSDFLPGANFYKSAHYTVNFEGESKTAELDILSVSDSATYIIEVKAHELSHKDKIRIKGLMDKIEDSINNALYQCDRSKKHILDEDGVFRVPSSKSITINKTKPIYKIVVTFQQFTMFLTDYESYQKTNLLDSSFDDTFVVSLFDLMAILDNMEDEKELLKYLEIRKEINKNKIHYFDELDLFEYFKDGTLSEAAKQTGTFILPVQSRLNDKYMPNVPV